MTPPSLPLLADRVGIAAYLTGRVLTAFAVSFAPWFVIALIWSNR